MFVCSNNSYWLIPFLMDEEGRYWAMYTVLERVSSTNAFLTSIPGVKGVVAVNPSRNAVLLLLVLAEVLVGNKSNVVNTVYYHPKKEVGNCTVLPNFYGDIDR